MTIDIKKTIVDGSKKALLTAAISGGASLLFLGGMEGAAVFGAELPRFVVSGATMGIASLVSDIALPSIVPWIPNSNAELNKFELTVLQPLLVGVASVVVDSILLPNTIGEQGGAIKSVVNGAGSSIVSYYVLTKMNIITN